MAHYIYITTNKKDGVLYIGVTTDLKKRIWQHKAKQIKGFTKTYNANKLVYFEVYDDYWEAANREKRMKNWNRDWKINLFIKQNPEWHDLYDEI